MARTSQASSRAGQQLLVLAVLSLAAVGAVTVLHRSQALSFQPYFGDVHPVLAVGVAAVLGVISLYFLQSRGWLEICCANADILKATIMSAVLPTLLGVVAIAIDIGFRFPRDLNLPLPWSLLFYLSWVSSRS
jgi:hypothetical protein